MKTDLQTDSQMKDESEELLEDQAEIKPTKSD